MRIQGVAGGPPQSLFPPTQAFSSPLYRIVISTPTGEYVIGCLGWDRMADVKRKLLEVGFLTVCGLLGTAVWPSGFKFEIWTRMSRRRFLLATLLESPFQPFVIH